jgi:hypothetical protein
MLLAFASHRSPSFLEFACNYVEYGVEWPLFSGVFPDAGFETERLVAQQTMLPHHPVGNFRAKE